METLAQAKALYDEGLSGMEAEFSQYMEATVVLEQCGIPLDGGTSAVWEKRWISGPFGSIVMSQCSERFDQKGGQDDKVKPEENRSVLPSQSG